MDFVLDSDSDGVFTPKASRIRQAKGEWTASKTGSKLRGENAPKPSDATLLFGASRNMSKTELQDAYRKLETPRMASRSAQQQGQTVPAKTAVFDASRERMRLARIIDSETNGEEGGGDQLFLSPIPLKCDPSGPMGSLKGIEGEEAPLQMSGFSDAEDIIAEFTEQRAGRPSASFSTARPVARAAAPPQSPDLGRLLHIDSASASASASENATPKFKNIRDELDQSKTRFRQSIADLLTSSPISAIVVEKGQGDFKDMVKAGSKLSGQVLHEIQLIEKKPGPGDLDSSGEGQDADADAEAEDNPFDEQQKPRAAAESSASGGPPQRLSRVAAFVRRVIWALFVVSLIFAVDIGLQAAAARQQCGLPLVDWEAYLPLDRIEEAYYEYASWVAESVSSWQPVVPN